MKVSKYENEMAKVFVDQSIVQTIGSSRLDYEKIDVLTTLATLAP